MNKRLFKGSIVNLVVSILCIITVIIYESYSYGQYSNAMRYMFIYPLCLGTILYTILNLFKIDIPRISFNLWNSAIAIFVSNSMLKGIVNISGRTYEFNNYYMMAGLSFIVLALISYLMHKTLR